MSHETSRIIGEVFVLEKMKRRPNKLEEKQMLGEGEREKQEGGGGRVNKKQAG